MLNKIVNLKVEGKKGNLENVGYLGLKEAYWKEVTIDNDPWRQKFAMV